MDRHATLISAKTVILIQPATAQLPKACTLQLEPTAWLKMTKPATMTKDKLAMQLTIMHGAIFLIVQRAVSRKMVRTVLIWIKAIV